MSKLISIIVPVYKVEPYIDRCIESLINQTYTNVEIILVDDESPDNCPAICDRYSQVDSRITVIHKKNEGLGKARNSGLAIAKGDYIIFVDSDDYVEIDMCENLISASEKYDADVVYGGVWKTFNDTGVKEPISATPYEMVWDSKEKVRELLLRFVGNDAGEKNDTIMEVSVWKALFKASTLMDNGISFVSEREMISEDLIFDIDFLGVANCVVWIPQFVYYYCVNSQSLSKTYREDRFLQIKKLYAEVVRKLSHLYDEREYQSHLDRMIITKARVVARQSVNAEETIGKKRVIEDLKLICADSDLQDALHRYKLQKLPLKYMMVALLMKYHCCWALRRIFK